MLTMPFKREPQPQLARLYQIDRSTDQLDSINKYPADLKALEQTLKYAQQTHNKIKQIDTLTAIGCLYCSLKDYVLAIKYLKQALQIAQYLRICKKVILVFYYMGEVYYQSEHYQPALVCYEKALKILEYSLEYSNCLNQGEDQKTPINEIKVKKELYNKYFNKRTNLAMILERIGMI
jgi:tetratricopeptide (TPR) repeat protein